MQSDIDARVRSLVMYDLSAAIKLWDGTEGVDYR